MQRPLVPGALACGARRAVGTGVFFSRHLHNRLAAPWCLEQLLRSLNTLHERNVLVAVLFDEAVDLATCKDLGDGFFLVFL